MEVGEVTDGIRKGKTQALAKAITLVENHPPEGREIIREVYGDAGEGHVIGITGFPGVGKSTLISRITEKYRGMEKTVGIIATDPGSPFTGGALLGDRLRLAGHDSGSDLWTDPGVFYRSVSTRGRAGGIAQVTGDAITLLDAFGFDRIVVETAGAGQSEVDVVKVADTSVVVVMPGVGDRIQFGKAGILEIADTFVVNKSDIEGASQVRQFLKEMLSWDESAKKSAPQGETHHASEGDGHCVGGSKLGRIELEYGKADDVWIPPIVSTVAVREKEEGIDDFVRAIEDHRDFLRESGTLSASRKKRAKREIESVLKNMMLQFCSQNPNVDLDKYAEKIVEEKVDQYTVAEEILEDVMGNREI